MRMVMLCQLSILLILKMPLSSGRMLMDTSNFTEYQRGTMNLILAASHGGLISAPELPERRNAGCYDDALERCVFNYHCSPLNLTKCRTDTLSDVKTKELTYQLADELQNLTSHRPYIVMSHLHRSRMDPNRGPEEATFGDSGSLAMYKEYHGLLQETVAAMKGPALLLDIHGQSHKEDWVEIGYAISKYDLNNGSWDCAQLTIKNLVLRKCNGLCVGRCVKGYVHGKRSFGSLLSRQGPFLVVPSDVQPVPGKGDYLNGGFTVRKYGSVYGGQVDAIQIESPLAFRKDDAIRTVYVKALARAVAKFYKQNYEMTSSKTASSSPFTLTVLMAILLATGSV